MDSTSSDSRINAALGRIKGDGRPNLLHKEALGEGEFRNSKKLIVKYEDYDRYPATGLLELSVDTTKDLSAEEIRQWFIHPHRGSDENSTDFVHPVAIKDLALEGVMYLDRPQTRAVWSWYQENYEALADWMYDWFGSDEDEDDCVHHWHVEYGELVMTFVTDESGYVDDTDYNSNPLLECCECGSGEYYEDIFNRYLDLSITIE